MSCDFQFKPTNHASLPDLHVISDLLEESSEKFKINLEFPWDIPNVATGMNSITFLLLPIKLLAASLELNIPVSLLPILTNDDEN